MTKRVILPKDYLNRDLSEREKDILRTVIHMYILNASPVGSRTLSKYLEHELKLSPATIRNVMADLEDMELISHPHTSAGRVPTDKGYRFYVDTLMDNETLSQNLKTTVQKKLIAADKENILRDASKLLGILSNCLAVVEIPHLIDLTIQKIELMYLSSTRLLVVIALDSEIVRTVTIEAEFEIKKKELENISSLINERISGRTLKFVQDNFKELVSDITDSKTPLIRLFVNSIDRLFDSGQQYQDRLHIAGTQNLLDYPEFEDLTRVRSVIELIENEEIIVHVLDKYEAGAGEYSILIGSEMNNKLLEDYSLISTKYSIGSASGSIGLIGPKRINYSYLTSLVQYVGRKITQKKT